MTAAGRGGPPCCILKRIIPFARATIPARASFVTYKKFHPAEWDKMKSNSEFIIQYADETDCFIPFEEALHVHKNLGTQLLQSNRGDHFMIQQFPELLATVLEKARA